MSSKLFHGFHLRSRSCSDNSPFNSPRILPKRSIFLKQLCKSESLPAPIFSGLIDSDFGGKYQLSSLDRFDEEYLPNDINNNNRFVIELDEEDELLDVDVLPRRRHASSALSMLTSLYRDTVSIKASPCHISFF